MVLTNARNGWVLRVFIDHPQGTEYSVPATPVSRVSSLAAATDDRQPAQGGSDISFADCERVSRELGAVLDVEDPFDHTYHLEVSSPGLDRPLRTVAHFQRFLGHIARVVLGRGIDGRRKFKGTLLAIDAPSHDGPGTPPAPASDADGGTAGYEPFHGPSDAPSDAPPDAFVTMNVDGTDYRIPFNDIETARLVPDWDALFHRGQRR